MSAMRQAISGLLAGSMILAGACGDDASVPPLPHLPLPPVTPPEDETLPEGDGYRVVPVATTGTVFGRVRYRGVRPRLAPFDVPRQNDACGQSQPNPVFVAGPAGGYSDVVVWLDLDEGAAPTPREEPVRVNQVGCRFEPHISVVHRGERVLFENSDPVLHNVHAEWLDGESWFRLGQPRQNDAAIQSPQRTGVVRLVCDAGHPWTLGFIHVLDHPYHAVTDADGVFRIEGVPVGSHRVRLWHASFDRRGEASGRPVFGDPLEAEAQVTVVPDAETEMNLSLELPTPDADAEAEG
jgi:plastocyanin